MSGFAEALKKGLDVHKRVEEARKEMDDVLDVASNEVSDAMQAALTFQFDVADRPARAQSLAEQVAGVPAPREKFEALTVRSGGAAFKVLAESVFGALGYPVTLRWENEFRMATDREEFEAVVKDLLAHGTTGAKIGALLQQK